MRAPLRDVALPAIVFANEQTRDSGCGIFPDQEPAIRLTDIFYREKGNKRDS